MLTVVIPTKNEEAYLPRLLASIRKQTMQPAEIIVADAHSTDQTREIAASFGAKVVEGGMPGPGRNRGAAHARTEYVLFLDADVELDDPTFIEKAVGQMRERRLGIATCDVFPMSEKKLDHVMHGAYNRYVRVLGKTFPHAPGFCMLVAKALHDEIKGFDETVTFCEDHDYARRATKKGRFGFLEVRVPVSVRRLDRDGRANIAFKYLLAEVHLATMGPIRHNLFNYSFGHAKDEPVAK
jgi:glycosyltransferase involved in cell wall biosynthesis